MPVSLEQILGAQNLVGLIQSVKSGIPRTLPDGFFNLTRDVISDYATYRKVSGTRQLPVTGEYGGPSKAAPQQDVSEVPVKLIHAAENQQYKQVLLQNLQGFTSPVPQKMAEDEVTRQTAEFKRRFENLRTAAVTSAIANNKIWLKSDGTFLFNSTGAAVTVDYQVPSTNTGDMSAIVSGAASWDNSSTDIIGQIIALKTKAVQLTGYPLRYAFYGKNVVKYLLNNTEASELIKRNPQYNDAFLNRGDIPGGFQELVWVPVYHAFAEDASGNIQQFFGDDQIVFTPEITDDWYEMLSGSYLIPENAGVLGMTATSVLSGMNLRFGMFSYAVATTDPIGIKQVFGDTFLPVIKNGSVVFNATVKF